MASRSPLVARMLRLLCCSIGAITASSTLLAEPDNDNIDMETVEVIGVAPISGSVLSDKLPYAIQTFGKEDIEQANSHSLADMLARHAGSVTINEAQNNPLQPDVRFRGFSASPLLGVSQGVVVYQNGVRLNETFGDTVNWDLLPASSVDNMNIVAGSNPVFGLNALGGAITIATKNGFSAPEQTAAFDYGSFDAREFTINSGGNNDNWGYFVAVDGMEEDGWRDFSASRALNIYTALSWRGAGSELDLYLNAGDTRLRGNGSAPAALLAIDREQVFTHPDITENRLGMTSLSFKHWRDSNTQLSLNLFYRRNTTNSFNGDGSEFEQCDLPLDAFLCAEEEQEDQQAEEEFELVEDQFGNTVASDFDAINNRSRRVQKTWGGTAQVYLNRAWFGATHHVTIGVDYVLGKTAFDSSVEFAELTAIRSTTRSGLFDAEGFTELDTKNRLAAGYLADTILLNPKLALTLSARYNSARVQTEDQSGERPELDGDHSYKRFNAGAGLTYELNAGIVAYAGAHQTSRTPTPVELACAHPEAPCNLPNTFLADPPLDDVVSRSYELGLRGRAKYLERWQVGLFHTANQDDILFQTTGGVSSNQGFFTNAADTVRMGLEFNLAGTVNKWRWFANYSYLQATFEDDFLSHSPNHPSAVDGVVQVGSGDRLPGIPQHNFKVGASYLFSERLKTSFDLIANSGQYLRGDEANLDDKTEAYVVANAAISYRLNKHVSFTAQVKNLFDKEYETFGLYGEADEVFDDFDDDETRFLGPGAPRTIGLGVKLRL